MKKHGLEDKTRVINISGTIGSIRRDLIFHAQLTESEYFIFTDCDDTLDRKRVKESVLLLEKFDIVVNDLCVANKEMKVTFPNYLSYRFYDGQILVENDLIDSNMMGLSNTSCSRKVLQVVDYLKQFDVVAFDWLFWSTSLLLKHTAVFTNKTSTKYRVYDNNIAGLPQKLDIKSINFGLNVKRMHYEAMLNNLISVPTIKEKLFNIEELINNKNFNDTIERILNNQVTEYPLWWENIR